MAVTWEKLLYESELDAWTGSTNLVTVGDLVLGGASRRITFDAGDYLEYDNASGYWVFITASPTGDIRIGAPLGANPNSILLDGNVWLNSVNDYLSLANNLVYDVGQSRWEYIASAAGGVMQITPAGIFQFSFATAGTAGQEATLTVQLQIGTDGEIILGGSTRRITFDTDDYLQYVSDTYHFYVGGVSEVTVDADGLCANDYVNAGSGYKVDGVQVYQFTPGMWTSTSWDGDARSDEGWTTVDTSTVFGVPAGVKAVSLMAAIRDSGGAGSGYFGIRKDSVTEGAVGVLTQVSDVIIYNNGIVECNSNGDFEYTVNASGANTSDVWLRITGYWI